RRGGGFMCKLPLSDQRVQRMIDALRRAGWHPQIDRSRPRRSEEYSVYIWRSFSPEDWDPAPLLQPVPRVILQNCRHTPDGKYIAIDRRELKDVRGVVGPDGWTFVVDSDTRALLEGADMKHLLFRKTAVMTQRGAEYDYDLD